MGCAPPGPIDGSLERPTDVLAGGKWHKRKGGKGRGKGKRGNRNDDKGKTDKGKGIGFHTGTSFFPLPALRLNITHRNLYCQSQSHSCQYH